MKKTISCLLAILVILTSLMFSASAATPIVGGDNISKATAVNFNQTYSSTISANKETAFYKVTLPRTGKLSYHFDSETISVLPVFLYNVEGDCYSNDFWHLNKTTGHINAKTSFDLTAGTFYLCVSAYSSSSSYLGDYSFTLYYEDTNESFAETETNRNNNIRQAYPIQLGKSYNGSIGINDSCDFYSFTVSSPCTLPFTLTSGDIQFWVYLYNQNGDVLKNDVVRAKSEIGEIDYSDTFSFSEPGTYCLAMIIYNDHYYPGKYTFTLGNLPSTSYTIRFNANGGSVSPSSRTVSAGTPVTLPTATRTGYTLLGWSTSAGASSATWKAGSSYTVNKDVTLYAIWQKDDAPTPSTQYTVLFDGNGGQANASSVTFDAGTSFKLPGASRRGYIMLGWSEDSDASSADYAVGESYIITKDVTLYAVWTVNPSVWQKIVNFFASAVESLLFIINFLFELIL